MKRLILGIIVAGAILFSGSVFAQKSERDFKNRPEKQKLFQRGKHEGFSKDSLTAKQKEAIQQINVKAEKDLKPLKDQLAELMVHHRTLMTAEKPDLNAVNASLDKIGSVRIAIEKAEAAKQIEIGKQLTDEQRAKMNHHPGFDRKGRH